MTELRDARLRKAMDEAPDAALRPQAGTRAAIGAAAHAAVQPRWQRWWPAGGERRMPWTAAFATVLLASLVAVMWQGQEIPGARPEAPQADRQAPVATAPAAAPAPAPAAAPAPAPAPATAPAPGPGPATGALPVPRRMPEAPPARAPARAPQAEDAGTRERQARGSELARAAPAARDQAAAAPAAGAPSPAAEAAPAPTESLAQAQPAPAQEETRARRAAAPPPAPTLQQAPAAPAPPAAAARPSAPAAAERAEPATVVWSQVRISGGGRSTVVQRGQAGALPLLVARMMVLGTEPRTDTDPVTLRLELMDRDESVLVLEFDGEHWHWRRPAREPGTARVLRADPALSAALRSEAQRLLGR